MPQLHFAFAPPADWEKRCEQQASLFQDSAWHQVLERGFKASTLYLWETDGDTAYTIDIFSAGPFRIGYLSFPTGGTLGGTLDAKHLTALQRARLPLDLLRIPVSGFGPPLAASLPAASVPETAIADLPQWQLSTLPKLRRDLAKARHTTFEIRDLEYSDAAATSMHALYRDTVLGHGGSLRYTTAYFQSLLALSMHNPQLRCIAAFHEQALCGYVVIALDSGSAYYLHGATTAEWKPSGVTDLLLYNAIDWAQQQGMLRFNLMASNSAQPGLIRYKEKFGGSTRTHHTYELAISPVRSQMFKGLLWLREQSLRLRPTHR